MAYSQTPQVPTAAGREDILAALRAAAAAKGSPLSPDELAAVYSQFQD